MFEVKLNSRQEYIIKFAKRNKKFQIKDVFLNIKDNFSVEKLTISRDLSYLEKNGILVKAGKGRSVFYELSKPYLIIEEIDIEDYFKTNFQERFVNEKFNFLIFEELKELKIFNEQELDFFNDLKNEYNENIKKLSATIKEKEFERLVIDLSWKSSSIEGNTYTLLETEYLIKEKKEAKGHTKEEAIMILNHKKTLEFIRDNKNYFKEITIKKIEEIHSCLIDDLGISKNFRKNLVGITGTKYNPLDNIYQIKEVMEKLCDLVNSQNNPFVKAFLLNILVAYIQPFEDGNKRTSRLLANAILIANNFCPLSYRDIDELEYKKAILLFYEINNISYFKKLFIEQLRFAVKNYFRIS